MRSVAMEDNMIEVDDPNEQPSDTENGFHSMGESLDSQYAGSAVNVSGFPPKRPTRESVLKRLSEALMRRTLTKVRSFPSKTTQLSCAL